MGSSRITAISSARVETTVEQNWRGAYDLLVTPNAHISDEASQTSGLVDPNFLALSGGGISSSQLDRVRALPGVEVAAPLAYVGDLTASRYGLAFGAVDATDAGRDYFTETPRVFSVSFSVTTTDGVRQQELAAYDDVIVTAKIDGEPRIYAPRSSSSDVYVSNDRTWASVAYPDVVPEMTSGIVAIDPEAEMALLGDAGSFAEPLAQFSDIVTLDGGNNDWQADLASLIDADRYPSVHAQLADNSVEQTIVPIVLSMHAYATVTADISLAELHTGATQASELTAIDPDGFITGLSSDGKERIDTALAEGDAESEDLTLDLTERLAPMTTPVLAIPLPGATDAPPVAYGDTSPSAQPALVPSAVYESTQVPPTLDVESGFQMEPQGFVHLTDTATEQTYREYEGAGEAPVDQSFLTPVGTYDPGDILGTADSVSYVPLGTYMASTAQVAEGERAGVTLGPTFTGLGAVLPPPGALTTIDSMTDVRPDASIDVIRVRVADVDDYSPSSIATIEDIASQIADMGLDVRVVAGSSMQPVGLYLPDYFAPGDDLGWTMQEWTSLGAAVRVEQASLSGTWWLLAISLGSVFLLGAAVATIGLAERRRDAALMRTLGWARIRITTWFLTETLPGLLLIGSAAAMVIVTQDLAVVRVAAATTFVIHALLMCVCTLLAGGEARRRALRTPRARSARTGSAVGRRVVGGHRVSAVLMSAGLVTLGTAVAAFATILRSSHAAVGTTRLADLVSTRLETPQLVLGVAALIAAVMLLVVGSGVILTSIRPQLQMLSTAGWEPARRRRFVRSLIGTALAPGLVAAPGVGAMVAHYVYPPALWVVLALVASALVIALAATLAATTREQVAR